MTVMSAPISVSITCSSLYSITASPIAVSPQYAPHGSSTEGFILPTFISSQEAGCPVNSLKVTSSSNSLVAHPDLNDFVTVGSSKVITAKAAFHKKVSFFM